MVFKMAATVALVLAAAACGTTETWSGGGDGHGPGKDGGGGDTASSDAKYSGNEQGLKGCNPQTFSLEQAPPAEVYLVLDRSGSMLEKGSAAGSTKWNELKDSVDHVLSQFESSIRFGLLMFPSDKTCMTPGPQVSVGLDNRKAVQYYLANAAPAGGTPTAAALTNAAQSLKDIGDATSPRFLLLATDGGPNCNYLLKATPACGCKQAAAKYCCTSYPQACYAGYTCLDDYRTVDVIKNLRSKEQITTFVIGLAGTAEYAGLLGAMAQAGGAPQTGGKTAYYPAGNKAELQAALKKIAVSVISCEIPLKKSPKYPDKVLVYIDGKLVTRDTKKKDGWDYVDSTLTKIKLYGSSCTTLQDGKKHSLTATFACVIN